MGTHILSATVSGKPSPHTVSIESKNGYAVFSFSVQTASFCLPYRGYNAPLFEGDVVEVFLSIDGGEGRYIEAELSPAGDLFLAFVDNADGRDKITLTYVDEPDCFVVYEVQPTADGYAASLAFPLHMIGEGARFNAYVINRESDETLFALSPTGEPRFHRPNVFRPLKDYLKQ